MGPLANLGAKMPRPIPRPNPRVFLSFRSLSNRKSRTRNQPDRPRADPTHQARLTVALCHYGAPTSTAKSSGPSNTRTTITRKTTDRHVSIWLRQLPRRMAALHSTLRQVPGRPLLTHPPTHTVCVCVCVVLRCVARQSANCREVAAALTTVDQVLCNALVPC